MDPPDAIGSILFGDGRTSINRLGGPFCVSLFQIALAQGKEELLEWPRPPVDIELATADVAQGA